MRHSSGFCVLKLLRVVCEPSVGLDVCQLYGARLLDTCLLGYRSGVAGIFRMCLQATRHGDRPSAIPQHPRAQAVPIRSFVGRR